MDDTGDDAKFPPTPYGMNQGYGSSNHQRIHVKNVPIPQVNGDHYVEDDVEDDVDIDEEEEEDEEDDDDDDVDTGENGVQRIGIHEFDHDEDDDDDDDYGDAQRHPKKRKLKSLLSSYEFAPRVPAPLTVAAASPKPGGRNSLTDWTEHETFVLLEAWGDKFLLHGRKSLRSEEWQEVAEKVSQESKIERTDTQCRNRLDTLKKKYKKEKTKLAETGSASNNWVYFKKLDMLLSSPPQQSGLSCGVDSGEYVFMNPKVYLNRANGLDEMRDSPGNSESAEGEEEEDSEGLPPKRTKSGSRQSRGANFKLLADSIQKFSDTFEKIENSKRQQMLELEKMRMDFHRELEQQKRQILERAQEEIAKIRRGDDEENDVSAENVSG